MDHCWTTGALESDVTLSITARELTEPLQTELNCTQLFGMHCRGFVGHRILIVNHLQLMHDDVYTECAWKSLFTEDSLPKQLRNRFTGQDDVDHTDLRGRSTGLANVEITGLPITTDGAKLTITGTQ